MFTRYDDSTNTLCLNYLTLGFVSVQFLFSSLPRKPALFFDCDGHEVFQTVKPPFSARSFVRSLIFSKNREVNRERVILTHLRGFL